MNLEDFITNTIVDIVNGANKANEKLKNSGSFIVGSDIHEFKSENMIKAATDKNHKLHIVSEINFDIAVTVSDESQGKGGGGIEIMDIFKLGGSKKETTANSNVSRIQFKIPVALPHSDMEEIHEPRIL